MEELRTFQEINNAYALPNDPTEHQRLALQHEGIKQMMHGQLFHAPVTNPSRILDVGCGTGHSTRAFASQFPQADVIGIDLSPVPAPDSTPETSIKEPLFVTGDIMSSNDEHLKPGSFDYIYSRLLVYGIQDWPAYISKAKDTLASGGWLELQELDTANPQVIGRSGRISTGTWLPEQIAVMAKRGIDMGCASKLEGYLREAGFLDVQAKPFRWMLGRWEGHPEGDLLAKVHTTYTGNANYHAYKRLVGSGKTEEELEAYKKDMMHDSSWTDGRYMEFFVVCGRKP